MRYISRAIDPQAILMATFAGAAIFLLTNIVLTPIVYDIEPQIILRYFGALALGPDVLLNDDISILIVGVLVHVVLSFTAAILIAFVVHRGGLLLGILGGALLGLAIYGINLYTLTTFVEWFFAINNNVLLLSHVLFGAVVGGVYEIFDHFDVVTLAVKEGNHAGV